MRMTILMLKERRNDLMKECTLCHGESFVRWEPMVCMVGRGHDGVAERSERYPCRD